MINQLAAFRVFKLSIKSGLTLTFSAAAGYIYSIEVQHYFVHSHTDSQYRLRPMSCLQLDKLAINMWPHLYWKSTVNLQYYCEIVGNT
jgi:hypothetical protein